MSKADRLGDYCACASEQSGSALGTIEEMHERG